MEDKVIIDVMVNRFDQEIFILMPLLEMYQEYNVLHWGTWRTFKVPDQRLGEQKTQDIPLAIQ